MYKHLKERRFYENIYDRHTIEDARRNIIYYDDFHTELKSRLAKDDSISRPGNAVILNAFYMQALGLELLHRYENRDQYITEWMGKDEAKDTRIATVQLAVEPLCQHCRKRGLQIIDKSLMQRGGAYSKDNPEEVLLTLQCPHCEKTSAFWEDGEPWKLKPTLCPKCGGKTTQSATRTKKFINFTYICLSCEHAFNEKMDLSKKKEEIDPNFEKDRTHFCLDDKEFRDHLFATRKGFEDMAKFGKELKEREDNKHIYDAINNLKKLKIAELAPLLSPALEAASYTEFSLDKPEVGKYMVIGFRCLDDKSDRDDRTSRKHLRTIVDQALLNTNWRLMRGGVSYRLGYLNGRLRAYEHEEDLIELVSKSNIPESQRNNSGKGSSMASRYSILDKDGGKIIL